MADRKKLLLIMNPKSGTMLAPKHLAEIVCAFSDAGYMTEVLMTTGLPGLLLALVFLMKVLYRGIRFSLCLEVPMDVRTLVIPLLAMLPYFMLESCLFTTVDLRTLFYFLMCGLAIGFARDFSY